MYSGHTGVDPYTTAVSDTYQDLFGEGIFTGKGLYDVDAFTAALADAVPENALLSHDLFEGLHARAALVSDIELVDEYPSTVLAHARRQHRWIRGDWQILLWLFPFVPTRHGVKRNPFSLISRWKILNNLRRSLVAPMLLTLLVAGWTVLPGAHWFWTVSVLAVMASQLLPLVAQMLVGPRRAQSFPVFWRNLRADAPITIAQVFLGVTFLAYHAWQTAHAIVLTLVRLTMTRRRLLEWETAAATAARAAGILGGRALLRFVAGMMASPIIAAVLALVVSVTHRASLPSAMPFLLLWFIAPGVAYWLSMPVGPRERPLSVADRQLLRRAVSNFVRLSREGLDGRYGFYESIDYQPKTPSTDAGGTSSSDVAPEIVRAFFAHHQGMSLVAMANILLDDVFVERFHADPRVQATELLLQERVPREAILAEARPAEGAAAAPSIGIVPSRRFRSPHTKNPHTHFLSNGRYTVALTHAGGGSSTWRDLAVTRRREDRTSDSGGQFVYLRDPWSGEVWSPSYQPICREPDQYEAVFELEKATYRRRDGDFETQLQVVVSPEDDVEVRRLSITNRGDRPREVEVTSYAEIVLARPEDDLAHPAFAKLFIETAYDAQSAGLLFSRRPRSAEEPHPWGVSRARHRRPARRRY